MPWFWRRSKKHSKQIRKAKGRNDKLNRELRAAGINPDLAYCTECGDWYNVRNKAALDLHAH
jgi:hypothetical protein